jgi:hypothetical protein
MPRWLADAARRLRAWWHEGEDGHADDEIDDGYPGCW